MCTKFPALPTAENSSGFSSASQTSAVFLELTIYVTTFPWKFRRGPNLHCCLARGRSSSIFPQGRRGRSFGIWFCRFEECSRSRLQRHQKRQAVRQHHDRVNAEVHAPEQQLTRQISASHLPKSSAALSSFPMVERHRPVQPPIGSRGWCSWAFAEADIWGEPRLVCRW